MSTKRRKSYSAPEALATGLFEDHIDVAAKRGLSSLLRQLSKHRMSAVIMAHCILLPICLLAALLGIPKSETLWGALVWAIVVGEATSLFVLVLYGLLAPWFSIPNTEDIKDRWAVIQSRVAVLALFIGACWAIYTFIIQRLDRITEKEPALEVRIHAEQVDLSTDTQNELIGSRDPIELTVPKKSKVRFVRGFVTIRNVGTSTTSLHLAERIDRETGYAKPCDSDNDKTESAGKKPEIKDWGEGGPVVVSRVTSL